MPGYGGATYILTNQKRGTLYVGSTESIEHRYLEHRDKFYPKSFSARYGLKRLVFVRQFSRIEEARTYERYLKGKNRLFKIELIEMENPDWEDIYYKFK